MTSSRSLQRRRRRIPHDRRLIYAIKDPAKQKKEAARQVPDTQDDIKHLEQDRREDTERLPGPEEYSDWRLYVSGAASGAFLEAVGNFIMWCTAGLSKPVSAVLALIGAMILPVFALMVARRKLWDELRVDRTKRLHLRAAAGFGVPILLGVGFVVAYRGLGAAAAGVAARFGWVPFTAVGIGGPAVVGILSSLALYLHGFAEAAARRRERRRLLQDLRGYLGFLESVRDGVGVGTTPIGPRGRRTVGPALRVVVVGVVAFAISPAGAGQERFCAIAVDRSASLNPAARAEACAKIEDSLDSFLDAYGCTALVLSSFSDEGAFVPREIVPVPMEPVTRDCSKAEPKSETGIQGVWEVFDNYRSFKKREVEDECRKADAERRAEWIANRAGIDRRVHVALAVPAVSPSHGTAISSVLQSLLEPSTAVVLLVTDGIERRQQSSSIAGCARARIVMVLVPTRSPYGTPADTVAAAATWRQKVPGLSVLFYPQLHPNIWRQIASR